MGCLLNVPTTCQSVTGTDQAHNQTKGIVGTDLKKKKNSLDGHKHGSDQPRAEQNVAGKLGGLLPQIRKNRGLVKTNIAYKEKNRTIPDGLQ